MKSSTTQMLKVFFEDYPTRDYKKGHIFIFPGESTEFYYYLVQGKMKVYDVTYRGDEIIINNFGPPAFFPLSHIINSSVSRYIYEASTDISIHRAPKDKIITFLKIHPDVVLDLLAHLYGILDGVIERMVFTTSTSAKTRLVYTIINQCKKFGQLRDDGAYVVSISEKELGSNAGLTRETVNREMKFLKIAKLIEVQHSNVIIPNLKRLEHYLEVHV